MSSIDPAARSMRIEVEVSIDAIPERVFAALTSEIDSWWTYRFHPQSTMRMGTVAGGRFLESWDGGELTLAVVARVQPGVLLAMTGPMGLEGEVEGAVTFTFVATTGGTVLSLVHSASGNLPDHAEEQYRLGWETLVGECLKPYVERGVLPPERRPTE